MTPSTRPTVALALAALLAACSAAAQRPWTPSSATPAAAPEEVLRGIDLSGLTPDQRRVVADWALAAFPYCGAPRTVAAALQGGSPCRHTTRMVQLAVRLAAAGLDRGRLAQALTDYYASFDARKRARLDVDSFGPPLGDAAAPVAIVEFSDFTCPACQLLRPSLEKFVADRPGRVRLHFKPYAIITHANSLEAAMTAEWARERGAFWKMHDTLFDNPYAYDPESLVGFARQLGLDGDDLEAALKSERYAPKVRKSMEEARAAGLNATPTLFFNGRMHRVTSFSEADLEFTLEDEEEWARHGGWIRD